ncbi:hypothetical protein ACA910_001553 [Epithemia clementina (nom. ined.)]
MGIGLYPAIVMEGDLSPDAFGSDVDAVCQQIHDACKGFGTDEDRLLKAMGGMTPEMRCKVPYRYKKLFGDSKTLKEVMKSECGNRDFGKCLQFLAVPPHVAECDMIHMACKGAGTNEKLLSTIIVGRSNAEMELLKKTYFDLHTEDLGRVLDRELGGHFEQLIVNCLQASEEVFDPEYHTEDKAKEDAKALYEMGQGKWGTNEKGLFKVLCAMPPEHMATVNRIYAEEYGYTLPKVMQKEFGGDTKWAAVLLLNMKLKPIEAVAGLIHDASAGFGTNELLFTATLIRYQSLLKAVMLAFVEEYGKPLDEVIKAETGGDYEKILLQILTTADEL